MKTEENTGDYLFYHLENEGQSKTFRDMGTDRWYYEHELLEVFSKEYILYIKNKYKVNGKGKS